MISAGWMKQLEDVRIVEAIKKAERACTGEIRVFVTRNEIETAAEVLTAARAEMLRLGIHKTADRNGVLIYLVPATRRVAVVPDAGAESVVRKDFWAHVIDSMVVLLKLGKATEAVVEGINLLGVELAKHFPSQPGDRNQLPDEVARDH